MHIAGRKIGVGSKPFIIAEMSGNHNQSLDKALEIVDAAAATGADALKLQTYTADTMTIDCDREEFLIKDPNSLWAGKSLYELFQQAHTPWDWHEAIFKRCAEKGLICFSSPFDAGAVDFLENLNAPCYKIASFENTDLNLIKRVAATGKPIIISTGMANLTELDEAVATAREAGCTQLALLKCTSAYPASADNANISTIAHLRQLFECEIGLSDHTLGIGVAVASVAFGASIIEKHFTISRAQGGVDAAFSLEPGEFSALVEETCRAYNSIGSITYGATASELKGRSRRRSLYVVEDIQVGTKLSNKNLRSIRPGLGLAPKYLDTVIGKKVNKDIPRGTPLAWDLLLNDD